MEKLIGLTPEELEKTAEAYETDNWPNGKTVHLGRPLVVGKPTVVISGRIGETVAAAFDAKAAAHGQTRAERLRELVTKDALAS